MKNQKKKTILIINPKQYGYAAGYTYYPRYLKDKFEIHFICFDQQFKKIHADGFFIHYINPSNNTFAKFMKLYKSIWQISREIQPDIIFSVYFKFVFIIYFISGKNYKILDIRTGSLAKNNFKRKLLNLLVLVETISFDRIAVLSKSLAELLHINKKKLFILPLGGAVIDNSIKNYNKIHLIYVGTLFKRELETTIEGLSLFLGKNKSTKEIKYDIIGFGREYDVSKLLASIKKNNLSTIINYYGRKNHNELESFFSNATIGISFVPQTKYFDAQPSTKIIEYSLSGLITIATKTSENIKMINESNGVLCESTAEDFCNSLLKVSQKLCDYSEEAIRKSNSAFLWSKIVSDKLLPNLSIYEKNK